jgi:ribosomal peptide maturation radical SAM protein 1
MPASCSSAGTLLLLHMPMAAPSLPNLAIEQLAQVLRTGGFRCDVSYPNLFLPRSISSRLIHGLPGPAIFAPHRFPVSEEQIANAVAAELTRIAAAAGLAQPDTYDNTATEYLLGMEAAGRCLARSLAAIPPGRYDAVGFSVIFDAQKLPSCALAYLLKQREPKLRILFGGTGCDGEMGPALMERFPEIDGVIQGEAERSAVAAFTAMLGGNPAGVPGMVYRDGDSIVQSTAPEEPPERIGGVIPDYATFITERAASPYRDEPLVLFYEASRGCWYGRKQHCNFCGIRNVDGAYREKDPGALLQEILDLSERYAPQTLYATDAILSREHIRTVLAELAARRQSGARLPGLFFETKSNLRTDEIGLIAAAGTRQMQPGIESFCTNTLRLMKKGATMLQQISCLKWSQAYHIELVYSILAGTPGETDADRHTMATLTERLRHLPPPYQTNRLGLHRFSPYFRDPGAFGISNVRPYTLQEIIYQTADPELLCRLCYELEYDLAADVPPVGAASIERLSQAVRDWRRTYFDGYRMLVRPAVGGAVVIRASANEGVRVDRVEGVDATVLLEAASVVGIGMLSRRTGIAEAEIEAAAARLEFQGVLIREDRQILALPVPPVEAWKPRQEDAGIPNGARPDGQLVVLESSAEAAC